VRGQALHLPATGPSLQHHVSPRIPTLEPRQRFFRLLEAPLLEGLVEAGRGPVRLTGLVDLRRAPSRGVKFLRDFLRFAESGGLILGDEGAQAVPLNPFEKDVFDELTAGGLNLLPQYGSSGYRIDMVAAHASRPGRYVLAIECDGASYHSAPLARERDRLRQEILQSLGWHFHRIWSTDWWNQREIEVARTRTAFEKACREVDEEDQAGSPPPPRGVTGSDPPDHAGAVPQRYNDLRPHLAKGLPIDEYQFGDLMRLVRYVRSDGRLYTDAELVDEMVRELGYRRRGRRIVEALMRAIEAVR